MAKRKNTKRITSYAEAAVKQANKRIGLRAPKAQDKPKNSRSR